MDESRCCMICLDEVDMAQKYAQPMPCLHIFHCHCMNQWLKQNRSCPLCRYPIQLQDQAKWFSLFTTAVLISHDMYIDRFILTITFLEYILKKYKRSAEWNEIRNTCIIFLNQFQYIGIRFPCLDVSTRTTAQKELRRWKSMFHEYQQQYPFEKGQKINLKQTLLAQVPV
jgi:hypothetical protein